MRNLVPFVQFKKREKHPWRSVNLSKVAGWSLHFTKINTPSWYFSLFLNCTNGTKSRSASQILLHKIILKPRPLDESLRCLKTKHYWHYQGEKLIIFKNDISWGWVTYRFLYIIPQNDACGWEVIANDVLKMTKINEF